MRLTLLGLLFHVEAEARCRPRAFQQPETRLLRRQGEEDLAGAAERGVFDPRFHLPDRLLLAGQQRNPIGLMTETGGADAGQEQEQNEK